MSKNEIGPGNHEKAWNDPPQLAFNASVAGNPSSNRLRMMKKRVPVPINSSRPMVPTEEKHGSLTLPPMSGPPKDGSKVEKSKEIGQCTEDLDSQISLSNVQSDLQQVLESLLCTAAEASTKDDIQKRINIMEKMWLEDKLHIEVKKKMKLLASAAKERNYDQAWSLHQSLIVDYTGECSNWMLGIKTLIAEARKAHSSATDSGPDQTKPSNELPLFLNPSQLGES